MSISLHALTEQVVKKKKINALFKKKKRFPYTSGHPEDESLLKLKVKFMMEVKN